MRIAGLIGALLLGAASSALAADMRWVLAMGWSGDLVLSTHPDYQDCRRALDAPAELDLPSIVIVPLESQ